MRKRTKIKHKIRRFIALYGEDIMLLLAGIGAFSWLFSIYIIMCILS